MTSLTVTLRSFSRDEKEGRALPGCGGRCPAYLLATERSVNGYFSQFTPTVRHFFCLVLMRLGNRIWPALRAMPLMMARCGK